MKILFVNPSLRPTFQHRYLPVGLCYVMTYAREQGFSFDLLDIDIGRYDDAYVEEYVRTHRYDVIAFGCIVTHYRWTKWFIHTVKKHQPLCKVVVGNSVGSTIPEILFAHTPVDVVVLGEGEVTLVELLRAWNEGRALGEAVEPEQPIPHTNGDHSPTIRGVGIEGIVFRDRRGRVVNNGRRKAVPDLDALPMPDWDMFDVETYLAVGVDTALNPTRFTREETRVMPVVTARGCAFKCTFCHYEFWNDPYRRRSAESVIAEIRRNQAKYGANFINFWDDLSFHKLRPAEKFVDAMIEADLGIHWTAAVRTDLFGRPEIPREERLAVARKFVDAGAIWVGFSLESGDDGILEAMNKHIRSEYFIEQVGILRSVGLVCATSVVFGYPQETLESIAKTFAMCREAGIYPSPGYLMPQPETGMWGYAVENGHITDTEEYLYNLTERQDITVNMTSLSNEELMDAVLNGLSELNDAFGMGLDRSRFVRTGGYEVNNRHQQRVKRLPDDDLRAQLNYANATYRQDSGLAGPASGA